MLLSHAPLPTRYLSAAADSAKVGNRTPLMLSIIILLLLRNYCSFPLTDFPLAYATLTGCKLHIKGVTSDVTLPVPRFFCSSQS